MPNNSMSFGASLGSSIVNLAMVSSRPLVGRCDEFMAGH
jgi:hypothetical protein